MTRHNFRLILGLILLVFIVKSCNRDDNSASSSARRDARDEQLMHDLDEQLKPEGASESKDGLAAAIAIDVSGSMAEKVTGSDGSKQAKIQIARSAALDLVDQFASYARDHKDEPVQLAIYEFSRRSGLSDARAVIEMGPPDRDKAAEAIAKLQADGGTPIGQAMIIAKLALDRTGLSRRHLLVVTDGENTDGVKPERVAVAMNKRPEVERPSVYFVAFDVEASRFSGVRDAGGLVLSAANAKELNDTLDTLLRGKILIEK